VGTFVKKLAKAHPSIVAEENVLVQTHYRDVTDL
jgi:hypothetical protein